jgi:hypothetical protein
MKPANEIPFTTKEKKKMVTKKVSAGWRSKILYSEAV